MHCSLCTPASWSCAYHTPSKLAEASNCNSLDPVSEDLAFLTRNLGIDSVKLCHRKGICFVSILDYPSRVSVGLAFPPVC